MNRTGFEELEMQVQQSGLSLKSYLRQIGVSYSTYHYWQKKYSAEKDSIKQELAPINIKRPTAELSLDERRVLVVSQRTPCPLWKRLREAVDGSVEPKSAGGPCLT